MADEDEELRVLTAGWDEPRRRAFLAAHDRFVAAGLTHERALMLALGELLP